MVLLPAILALASVDVHRCATSVLYESWKPGGSGATPVAARQVSEPLHQLQTEHFVIWWSSESADHRILGEQAAPLAGDSVPGVVRVSATALEKAWRGYVDTLGYDAPVGASVSRAWGMVVPSGKIPVEFCNVRVLLRDTNITKMYFGGAMFSERSNGSSYILLASNLATFPGRQMVRDLDGAALSFSYSNGWREVQEATCAHELFHAIQFRYETDLDAHGFFEASAIAMETRLASQSKDYLQYAQVLSSLGSLVPFPTGVRDPAYPQGWFVRGMATDLGVDVIRGLWESRKASGFRRPSFLSTMRQILPGYRDASNRAGSFEAELARQSIRLALTGKRSVWQPSDFVLYPDAGQFPTLTGVLRPVSGFDSLRLGLGAVQVQIDTTIATEDRLQIWIPDEGVEMGRAWKDSRGTKVAWHDGSVRWDATDSVKTVWAFANPGNPTALRAASRDESSCSWRRSTAAPARTPAHLGQNLTWSSPAGPVLEGTSRGEALTTPLLHVDVWKPSASKDPFAASMVAGGDDHVLVLEDADRLLALSGATLRWPGNGVGSASIGSGDGIWTSVPVSNDAGSGIVQLGDLDLSHPVRILWAGGSAPRALSVAPRPNPSRHGEPISFPIAGATGTERLEIFAADGALVQELHANPGQGLVVWDLKNREHRSVRPGVYRYLWRGVTGSKQGQLLVAD